MFVKPLGFLVVVTVSVSDVVGQDIPLIWQTQTESYTVQVSGTTFNGRACLCRKLCNLTSPSGLGWDGLRMVRVRGMGGDSGGPEWVGIVEACIGRVEMVQDKAKIWCGSRVGWQRWTHTNLNCSATVLEKV